MYDVITLGSAAVDAFAETDAELHKFRHNFRGQKSHKDLFEKMLCYHLGSKLLINHLGFMTGGGGTNTAACFSKLGLKAAYLG